MASSDRAAKASAISETRWPMDSFGKARTISGGGSANAPTCSALAVRTRMSPR